MRNIKRDNHIHDAVYGAFDFFLQTRKRFYSIYKHKKHFYSFPFTPVVAHCAYIPCLLIYLQVHQRLILCLVLSAFHELKDRQKRNRSWHFCETFPGETQHKLLLTPDREPKTSQINDYTRVQLDEPVSLFRLLTGIWIRHCLEKSKSKTARLLQAHAKTVGDVLPRKAAYIELFMCLTNTQCIRESHLQ